MEIKSATLYKQSNYPFEQSDGNGDWNRTIQLLLHHFGGFIIVCDRHPCVLCTERLISDGHYCKGRLRRIQFKGAGELSSM